MWRGVTHCTVWFSKCIIHSHDFVWLPFAGTEMTDLSDRLNYDREVIRVWFCNKRQALKNTIKKLKTAHDASGALCGLSSSSSPEGSSSSGMLEQGHG